MHILVISTLAGWAGSEELWAATANAALEDGHQVTVAVYRWPHVPVKIAALERRGASVIRVPLDMPLPIKALRRLSGGRVRIRAVLDRYFSPFRPVFDCRPDVILLSEGGTYDSLHIPGLVAWLHNTAVPYVTVSQLNGDQYVPESRSPDEALAFFGRAHLVGFVSARNQAASERQLATCLTNARVVRNPVNLHELDLAEWPASSTVGMACVARLDVDHKAHDVLFETLASPVWRERDWCLALYGQGPDRPYLERLAAFYGLSRLIRFAGHVSDVRSIWRENHLFLLASRREGTPLALVEAMICGRPAVTTDVGGNTEWLEDGRTGFVAEAPTVLSYGAALERAWQQQADWREMGRRAHGDAMAKIDPDAGRSLLGTLVEAAEQPWTAARHER